MDNLLLAWQEFVKGKRNKPDVQEFSYNLIDNILQLHEDLRNKTYKHGGYYCFNISDPKPRNISKASVRDRLVHHAVYRILYPFFDQTFIYDSYSCRLNKGTHKAIRRFHSMFLEVSDYNRKTCWVLKLDIKKFFASIDHEILKDILAKYISNQDILWLIGEIIDSFWVDCFARLPLRGTSGQVGRKINAWHKDRPPRKDDSSLSLRAKANQELSMAETKQSRVGLPLGNLTSQLFVNVYMNEFDQFVKHKLKVKYYIRYADDFMILHPSHEVLTTLLYRIVVFLKQELRLTLHPNKIFLKTMTSGVDFLGWVNFSNHRVLRTASKHRMMRRLNEHLTIETLQAYLGLLKHGNAKRLEYQLLNRLNSML